MESGTMPLLVPAEIEGMENKIVKSTSRSAEMEDLECGNVKSANVSTEFEDLEREIVRSATESSQIEELGSEIKSATESHLPMPAANEPLLLEGDEAIAPEAGWKLRALIHVLSFITLFAGSVLAFSLVIIQPDGFCKGKKELCIGGSFFLGSLGIVLLLVYCAAIIAGEMLENAIKRKNKWCLAGILLIMIIISNLLTMFNITSLVYVLANFALSIGSWRLEYICGESHIVGLSGCFLSSGMSATMTFVYYKRLTIGAFVIILLMGMVAVGILGCSIPEAPQQDVEQDADQP